MVSSVLNDDFDGETVSNVALNIRASNLVKFPLVGGEDATSDTCGKFSGSYVCPNVELHEEIGRRLGLGDAYKNKAFVHKVHFSCDNPRCMVCCRYGWAVKKARVDSARLEEASKVFGEVEHFFVSINPKDYGITDEKVYRAMMQKALKALGVVGAVNYFHGSRHRRFEHVGGGVFRQIGLDWSPHYHGVGFLEGGYKCRNCDHKSKCVAGCGGFDDRRWQYYLQTGIYVGVKSKRQTVFGTCWYLLHHTSVERNTKRFHSATLFGVISYRKMKFKAEKKKLTCKICQYEMDTMYDYVGKKHFVYDRNASGYVRDSVEDWLEDGVCVWVERPKRVFFRNSSGEEPRYGSMEWLKSHRNRGGSFESG